MLQAVIVGGPQLLKLLLTWTPNIKAHFEKIIVKKRKIFFQTSATKPPLTHKP